ncbi:MAG: alcohol dehydrogenase, partial [Casimicrobium sp.]
DFSPANIKTNRPSLSTEALFLETFKKTYQECVSAFNIVMEAYAAVGYRKADESVIPLRIEIDSFISFVRDRKTQGESWKVSPLRSAKEQHEFITGLVHEWRLIEWPHFETEIVGEWYPRLCRAFESADSVLNATDDTLVDALSTLHSFYERLRFNEGGLAAWKRKFLTINEPDRIRQTLAYLVFGKDPVEVRMANTIFSADYKLKEFGRASVQELIGWRNRENLPIINGRTTKILRFFGSHVRQIQ